LRSDAAPAGKGRLDAHLHAALALCALWLVGTSPWIGMLRRVPAGAGWLDYTHVALGWLTLLLAIAYAWSLLRGGRAAWYFPWLAGQAGAIGRDLAGLLRGSVPPADGPGLYGAIKGLLLLALLATALTGAAWHLAQGADAALMLRGWHAAGAKVLIGAGVAHALAVASHLLEL
jgi:hypothetical protein